MKQTQLYNNRINAAIKADFEIYLTHVADDFECTILTNTNPKSQYNGECLDLWENGQYEQYTQFKGQHPIYEVG